MSKIQPVNFRDLGEFLDCLPDHERIIVDRLREIVISCIPECKEKLSYNVPYYYRHARICFIWPASVPWGKVKSEGVQLGFCYGNLLDDEAGYLEQGKRKQVYSKTFSSVDEIDEALLKSYLFDAVRVDEQVKKKK